jgi:hypothetical protein
VDTNKQLTITTAIKLCAGFIQIDYTLESNKPSPEWIVLAGKANPKITSLK